MTALSAEVWQTKLSDLREEIVAYLALDPAEKPVPVSPGIHFFMGGMRVDDRHETNVKGLYAAGEAACKYHGANRLGGNSLLGALFGGRVAALAVLEDRGIRIPFAYPEREQAAAYFRSGESCRETTDQPCGMSSPAVSAKLREALLYGLGIVREEKTLQEARKRILGLLGCICSHST